MSRERTIRWGMVAILVLLIWSILPFGSQIVVYIQSKGLLQIALIAIVIISSGAIWWMKKNSNIRFGIKTWTVSIFSLCCYLWFIIFTPHPVEGFHLLEYGLLAIVIYRALSLDMSGYKVSLLTITLVIGLGWFDEIIQYFLPDRYYDIRDVVINGAGGLLGLAIILACKSENRQDPPFDAGCGYNENISL